MLIDKKRIEAPFAGELGIRLVNLGQFIAAGQPIVTLQSIAPIHVNFALPEARYPMITHGQAVEVAVDAFPDRQFAGTVNAISPEVSETTRNFNVQATLPNDARLLRPGMFAQVTVALAEWRNVVTVPATAISYSPPGDAVFVVVGPPAIDTPGAPTASAGSPAPLPACQPSSALWCRSGSGAIPPSPSWPGSLPASASSQPGRSSCTTVRQ